MSFPDVLLPEIKRHIDEYAAGGDGLLFEGQTGQPVNRKTFYRAWKHATQTAGMAGFHFTICDTPETHWRLRRERAPKS